MKFYELSYASARVPRRWLCRINFFIKIVPNFTIPGYKKSRCVNVLFLFLHFNRITRGIKYFISIRYPREDTKLPRCVSRNKFSFSQKSYKIPPHPFLPINSSHIVEGKNTRTDNVIIRLSGKVFFTTVNLHTNARKK